MNALRNVWRQYDHKLLLVVCLIMIGILFSVYKAATSTSSQNLEAPAYRNQPPTAVAPATINNLINDSAQLTAARLPDDVHQSLSKISLALTPAVARFSLSEKNLTDYGLAKDYAPTVIATLNQNQTALQGRAVRSIKDEVQLTSADVDDAQMITEVDYGPLANSVDGGPISAIIRFNYHLQEAQWNLESVEMISN